MIVPSAEHLTPELVAHRPLIDKTKPEGDVQMAPIQILIVDDHQILRAGLRRIIHSQPDMIVVGEAGTVDEAVRQTEETHPNVVIMDIVMPGVNGIKGIERLRRLFPAVRALALSIHDEEAYVRAVMSAGGFGYVVKTAGEAEFLTAIRSVHGGRLYFNQALGLPPSKGLETRCTIGADPLLVRNLSERELCVLRCLANGLTSREIAAQLSLSAKTVETYRARIADKVGLRKRSELVQFAIQLGLLS